jgi:hypothetical protein
LLHLAVAAAEEAPPATQAALVALAEVEIIKELMALERLDKAITAAPDLQATEAEAEAAEQAAQEWLQGQLIQAVQADLEQQTA